MQWIARASRTHFYIGFAALLAFLSTFAYLESLDKKIAVAQLTHDVAAGEVISVDDVDFVEVSSDSTLNKHIVTGDNFSDKTLVARVDLSRSDLLTQSNTSRRSSKDGLRSLSIGLTFDRANGGDIKMGDIIDIWQTGQDSRLVAQSVPVREVITPNKRLGISTSQTVTIVMGVTSSQARDLSGVVGSDEIMIVLSTGTKTTDDLDDTANENDSPFQPLDETEQAQSSKD